MARNNWCGPLRAVPRHSHEAREHRREARRQKHEVPGRMREGPHTRWAHTARPRTLSTVPGTDAAQTARSRLPRTVGSLARDGTGCRW